MAVLSVLKAFWHRKIFIVYMCLLGAVITLSFKTFVLKDTYTYIMDYYITNSELAKLIVDVNSLETDIHMAESCRIMLKSELALDTVGEMLLEKYGEDYLSKYFQIEQGDNGAEILYENLYDCIDVESVDDGTSVLEVSVKSENPYIAKDIGQFLTYIAPHIIYYYVGADYVSPYENAKLYINYDIPGNKKIALLGAVAAFALAACMVFAEMLFSKNIITDYIDVKDVPGLILLGSIPYYKMQNSEEGNN